MKDAKLVFMLVGMTAALGQDRREGRTVAAQVVAELGCMPESAISDDPEEASRQAMEWVVYSYGAGELPGWYPRDAISKDW